MPFSQTLFLVNPSRAPQRSRRLLQLLERRGAEHIVVSRDREHFIREVEAFATGSLDKLIVWGGDGTVHDAINALVRASCPGKAVGFLRGGSGNGIQDSYEVPFGLARQVEAYAESAEAGRSIAVDLISVDDGSGPVYGQLFGLGFDVQVLERRARWRSRKTGEARRGLLNYVVSGLTEIVREPLFDGRRYLLELSKGRSALRGTRTNAEFPFERLSLETESTMIEIGVRPYYGWLFKVCPDVVCNDGFLDLYLFNFAGKFDIVRNVLSLWNGWHDRINRRFAKSGKPLIERFEIRELSVSAEAPFPYHIDGELRSCESREGRAPRLELRVLPAAITFLVPEPFYRKFHAYDEIALRSSPSSRR